MTDALDPLAPKLHALGDRAGVLILNEDGLPLLEHNADAVFSAASVIKVPLVMALHAEAHRGAISLDERLPIGATVDGSGILRDLHDVANLSLRDHATLAITLSDNTATNRLIERLGTDVVNRYLDRWGCRTTRLRRRMYDFEAARCGLENEMTPREAAVLLGMLVGGEGVEPWVGERVLKLLERNQDDSMLRRCLPAEIRVAHKTGSLAAVRNDIGIIWGTRPVIVAAFTRDLRDLAEGDAFLGLLGWCAARVSGVDLAPLPSELSAGA
ncbi:MAG: class A beta-lactamase-related serine hydrolase [Chloroflexota bacterium]|nr:class A beta-lactamase-related serine hydrolase [Chloroflexota bacterium]